MLSVASPMAKESDREDKAPAAGAVYAEFIRSELDAARATTTMLEQRSAFIVTSSGALVSLLFGFTAAVGKKDLLHVTSGSRYALYVALACFAAASAVAIASNLLIFRSAQAPTGALRQVISERWDDPAPEAQQMVTVALIEYIDSARRSNAIKGLVLAWGLAAEMLGVLAVAVAVADLIHTV